MRQRIPAGYGIGAGVVLQLRGDRHKAGDLGGEVQRGNQHAGEHAKRQVIGRHHHHHGGQHHHAG